MNLILDFGNSQCKFALYKEHELYKKVSFDAFTPQQLLDFIAPYKNEISKGIISNVNKDVQLPTSHFPIYTLDENTKLPFINKYATPQTLGKDRIALVAAAFYKFPHKNCLIIDAGTCVTYDFIHANGEYLGGGISPGLRMRYQALNTFTARLPIVTHKNDFNLIGSSTNDSILSGTGGGFIREIQATIEGYQERYPSLTIILTGGDAHLLVNKLKIGIFAAPEFLMMGLNEILEYNAEKL